MAFGQIFRIIFVLFTLYLMGDAFYRWDGFSYYGTFSDFLPATGLILILWCAIAAFTAFLFWLLLRISERLCQLVKLNIHAHQLLFLFTMLGICGLLVWAGKRHITSNEVTPQFKLVVLTGVLLVSLFFTWLIRNQLHRWIEIIQERITPLVWLFAVCTLLSFPLVAYHTWFKDTDAEATQTFVQPVSTGKYRPNILLVTFDALTTNDMSTYGYHRETSPFITEWAKTASLFNRLEAEANYTAPTTASLMTGKRVWTHGRLHPNDKPPHNSKTESLPLLLKNNGYHTMAFIANTYASADDLGMTNAFSYAPSPTEFTSINSLLSTFDVMLDRFFLGKFILYDWIIKEDFIFYKILLAIQENFDQLRKRHSTRLSPSIAFDKFLTVLDADPPKPFFAWIHVYPPHDPYLPPDPYMGMYGDSSELRTATAQYKILMEWYKLDKNPNKFKFPEHIDPSIVDVFRDRYNEFIRYCDKQFEDFVTGLSERDILKDTVVIVSADHGDIFRIPHLTHGSSLYEPETNIPFIIKEPAQSEGMIINDLVEQIDIPATILEIASIPVPSWMEGRSVVPLLRGKELPPKNAFAMLLKFNPSRPGERITKGDIAVWEDDYKLIYNLERDESMLFNLKQDSDELYNLSDKEPDITKRLINIIRENLDEVNEKIGEEE